MSGRRYTVLIIPEGSHRVRRMRLRRGVVQALAGVLTVILVALGLLAFDYHRSRLDQGEFSRLQIENRRQKLQLQQLTVDLKDLQKELVVLAQNDAKVRVMAKLTTPRSDALDGVGGAPETTATDPERVTTLQQQIDQVRQAIELQRESQEEIQGFLNDQRSLLAAKPQGWPVKGWLTSDFGMRKSPFTGRRKMHEGLDIAARTGTPVYVTADGIVRRAETVAGYGKLVVVDHGYGFQTYYGHNSKLLVRVGQRVKRGEQITEVGNTGSSTGSHVHYEVRRNGVPLNPRKFL